MQNIQNSQLPVSSVFGFHFPCFWLDEGFRLEWGSAMGENDASHVSMIGDGTFFPKALILASWGRSPNEERLNITVTQIMFTLYFAFVRAYCKAYGG